MSGYEDLLMMNHLYCVTVFTHMVTCHQEETLNYKFKHKKASKCLSDVDRVVQWVVQKSIVGSQLTKGSNVFTHYRS